MDSLFVARTTSPAGPLFLAASSKGLVRLEFHHRMQKIDDREKLIESESALRPYLQELDEYFAGERSKFTIPLDLRGTPFQLACWNALLKIPYGETRSYGEIARAIGHPQLLPRRRHGE
jgi:O6-methylguanine-DNA--protein-cysteine methyltransferase